MNKTRNALMVALLMIAGLVGMIALSSFSVTHPAQAQTNKMAKWESHVETGNSSLGDLQGRMNRLGEQGWEVVNVVQTKDGNFVAFFKRPKT